MMEVVLSIKIPDSWVEDIGSKYDAPIRFLDCLPFGKSGGRGLIEINGSETEINDIIADIKKHQDICKVEISPLPEGGVLGSITTKKCVACKALMGSDCFLTSALTRGDGRIEWRLLTGESDSLSELISKLKDYGCEVELKKSTHLSKRSMLTSRQEEIIRMALDKGYYDIPKRITIEELAKSFKVSPSTLAEILQRGERKIIMQHFNG